MTLLATIAIGAITNAAVTTSVSSTSGASPNWTFIIATFTICLTAMATLIKIFSNTVKKEDKPGDENPYCQQCKQKLEECVDKIKSSGEKGEKIKEVVTEIDKVVAAMLKDNENLNKGVEEIKKDYRELAHRLDGLLKQLMSWMAED